MALESSSRVIVVRRRDVFRGSSKPTSRLRVAAAPVAGAPQHPPPTPRQSGHVAKLSTHCDKKARNLYQFSEVFWRYQFIQLMCAHHIKVLSMCLAAGLFMSVAAAQQPTQSASVSSLLVSPPIGIVVSGSQGGPFSPSTFQYRVSASVGLIDYSVRTPSWLTATPSFGTADTGGVTITFTLRPETLLLQPGSYGPRVAFTNVTNGKGSATRRATLTVRARSIPRAIDGGDLLDHLKGYLRDDRGEKLLAR
jgi:hypothetical protein